jgi:hypothetical protein
VEPLPEGTSDFNWYEGGWDYVDDKSIIIYGNLASGSITGQVIDRETTLPIENAVISTDKGGYSATTGSTGSYSISGIKVGTFTVRASAAGYQSQSQSVAVAKDAEQTVNFSLPPAEDTCPIEMMLPSDVQMLSLLRNYRDRVLMKSAEGRAYVKRYYEHAPEIVTILLLNRDITSMAFAAVNALAPSLEKIVAGKGSGLSGSQYSSIESLIEKMKKVSSQRLRNTLCLFEQDIRKREVSRKIFAASHE